MLGLAWLFSPTVSSFAAWVKTDLCWAERKDAQIEYINQIFFGGMGDLKVWKQDKHWEYGGKGLTMKKKRSCALDSLRKTNDIIDQKYSHTLIKNLRTSQSNLSVTLYTIR